ncbi:MAG: hypothetical protein ACI37T_05045 [Candidatus Gastranaerophilaceae bacterium]
MIQNRDELMPIESSLRNYFLKEKGRYVNKYQTHTLMKYRGLSLSLNDENPKNSLFAVCIGGLEAQFNVEDGIKTSGSLAGDEKFVYQWYWLGGNKEQMLEIIEKKHKNMRPICRHYVNRTRYCI